MSKATTRSVLGTHVGRRLTTLFLGCALLPLAGFGWLALRQVSDSLHAEVERTLHASAKSAGMDLARSLLTLADELDVAAALCTGGRPLREAPAPMRAELQRLFTSIARVDGDQVTSELGPAPPTQPPLSPADRHHLATGKALARVVPQARGHGIVVVRPIDARAVDSTLLVAAVRNERLIDIEALRGSGTEVMILAEDNSSGDQRRVLATSLGSVPDLEPMDRSLGTSHSAGTFQWQVRGEPHVARYWRVFLQPQLGMDWFIVQSRARATVEMPLATFRETFLMTALLTVLLVVGFSIAQIRRTVVPIQKLVEVTRSVARGELDARAAISGSDEFAQLGASFDHMTEQLVENIRRREVIEIDLIAARDAALDAVKAKAGFLTNVTHELRTPLTSIVGAAEILRDFGGDDPATRGEFLGIIVDQTARLQRLIEGVLALQNESNEPFVATDLGATLQQAIAALPESTRARISLEIAPDLPIVGAPARLAYAWQQLLDNAAKFSSPGSPIQVIARRRGDSCAIDFVDRGVGIATNQQDRIFEPFVQLGDLLTAKASGIGLGLTLARNIVSGHGGRLSVTSTPERGSTFRASLPAAGAQPNTGDPADVRQSASAVDMSRSAR